jgi:hypothetical protein
MISMIPHTSFLQRLRQSCVPIITLALVTTSAVQSSTSNNHTSLHKEFSGKTISQPAAALLITNSKERVKIQSTAYFTFAREIKAFHFSNPASLCCFYTYIPSFIDRHRYARFSRSTFS